MKSVEKCKSYFGFYTEISQHPVYFISMVYSAICPFKHGGAADPRSRCGFHGFFSIQQASVWSIWVFFSDDLSCVCSTLMELHYTWNLMSDLRVWHRHSTDGMFNVHLTYTQTYMTFILGAIYNTHECSRSFRREIMKQPCIALSSYLHQ